MDLPLSIGPMVDIRTPIHDSPHACKRLILHGNPLVLQRIMSHKRIQDVQKKVLVAGSDSSRIASGEPLAHTKMELSERS